MDLSIIIINKNYEKFIQNCISSCLSQKTKYNYEIIIVDDGSKDGSIKIINKNKDKKIKKIYIKNQGIEKASNTGISKSEGKFIMRLDSDDYLNENCVDVLMKIITKKKYSFVYGDYFLLTNNNKIKKIKLPQFNKKEILERGDFLASGTIFNKSIIKKLNYYNESIKNSGLENYELILNLILKKYIGFHVNKPLFYYRKHKNNLSKKIAYKIKKNGQNLFKRLNLSEYKMNKYNPHLIEN